MNNAVLFLFGKMLFILKTHVTYRYHTAACVWYGSLHNTSADPYITLLMVCLTSVFRDLCGVNVVQLCEGLKWQWLLYFSSGQATCFWETNGLPSRWHLNVFSEVSDEGNSKVSGSHSGTTGSWNNVAVSESFNFFGLLLQPALWNHIWYMRYGK